MDKNEYGITIKKSTYNIMILSIIVAVGTSAFFLGMYVSDIDSDSITQTDLNVAISKLESKIENTEQITNQDNSQLPARISIDDDPMKGNPDAPITIIEFSDYECPFCGRFYSNTLPLIEENYINTGKVNFVYRDFPIQSIHPNAVPAALAAECADDQDMYWEFHDMVFENKPKWERLGPSEILDEFKQYAAALGLNSAEFDSCLESGKHLEEIRKDLEDGRNYGVTGTPGFFIGSDKLGYVKVSGAKPYQVFESILDDMSLQ